MHVPLGTLFCDIDQQHRSLAKPVVIHGEDIIAFFI